MAEVLFEETTEGFGIDRAIMHGMLEALGISEWQFDPAAQVIAWRPGIAGREPGRASVIRETMDDLVKRYQGEDRPKLAAHYEEALRTGASGPQRFRVRRRNGAIIFIESVAITGRSSGGKLMIHGLMRDCRNDVVHEQAIHGLNSLMQQLIDHSHHAIVVIDGDQRILHTNANVYRFLALDPKTSLHKTGIAMLSTFAHVDLRPIYTEVQNSGREHHMPVEVETAPGDKRQFDLCGYPWFRPNGRPGGVVVRLEFNDSERADEARSAVQRMMDSLPDLFIVFDRRSGIFRFANRAAREKLGLRLDELGTHSAVETVFPRHVFDRLREATATGGSIADQDVTLTSYMGPKRRLILSAAGVTWDNEPSVAICARPPTLEKAHGGGFLGMLTG